MIKEKDLGGLKQIRFPDGDGITLQWLQEKLADEADKNAIRVAFEADKIKFGGLIGGSVEDCIVLYHPEHKKDYFWYAFRITTQGKYAFLNSALGGYSKLLNKADAVAEGGSILKAIGLNKKKLEEEQNWYTIIDDIIDNVVNNA